MPDYPVPSKGYNGPCPDCGAASWTYMVTDNGFLSDDEGMLVSRYRCTHCGWLGPLDTGGNQDLGKVVIGNPHKRYHAKTGHDRLTAADLGLPSFVVVAFLGATRTTWTDMPLTSTEFLGSVASRTKADLTGLTEARLLVAVVTPGAATAKLKCRYSTDQSTWNRMDTGEALDPEIEVSISSGGLKDSGWKPLVPGALADVFLRLQGEGGDALTDPVFGKISLQVRG